MIASGYTLDLYCDRVGLPIVLKGAAPGQHKYDEFPHVYFGETRAEVTREARKDGWRINWAKRTCVCPRCTGKGK